MKEKTPPTWTRAGLAKAAGVGAETLRFYEQKGLVEEPRRSASGYRLYQESDLERLRFIRRSQDLGFSLQDIKQILELTRDIRTPRRKVRDFAEAKLETIRRKISDLRAMESALAGLVVRCDGKGALKGCPIAEFIGGHPTPISNCHE